MSKLKKHNVFYIFIIFNTKSNNENFIVVFAV